MPVLPDYREFAPPAHLATHVECFWTGGLHSVPGRVVPDTCVDFIFSRGTGLQIVGSMTRVLLSPASPDPIFGVRLRAGAVPSILSLPLSELRDQVVAFSEFQKARLETDGESEVIRGLELVLSVARPLTSTQLAIAHLAANGGMLRLDDAARMSGISLRQFRRHCIEQTGLSPKTLARISRFRRAWELAISTGTPNWADLAIDCGYYDQAHLVNEFVEFSGLSPAAFLRTRQR